MAELKPCPFCGHIPKLEITDGLDGSKDYQVSCQYCFASTYYEDTAEDAAAEWNRRYENGVD